MKMTSGMKIRLALIFTIIVIPLLIKYSLLIHAGSLQIDGEIPLDICLLNLHQSRIAPDLFGFMICDDLVLNLIPAVTIVSLYIAMVTFLLNKKSIGDSGSTSKTKVTIIHIGVRWHDSLT